MVLHFRILGISVFLYSFLDITIPPSVLTALYLAKLRRIFAHLQGGFSTA